MRTVLPILLSALGIGLFAFLFSEYVAIDATNIRDAEYNSIYNYYSESGDNIDVLLSDMHEGYVVSASSFSNYDNSLHGVVLIVKDVNGGSDRYTAQKAIWDEYSGVWELYDVQVSKETGTEEFDKLVIDRFTMDPDLFRNHSSDVTRMKAMKAIRYLQKIKTVNIEEYASLATQFWKRIFNCLTPFVMMLIACSMNYRFKKNTMFFSLLVSLCLAVVYYVMQMLTVMLAEQGIVGPIIGNLMPLMAVVIVNVAFSVFFKRN